MAGPSPLHRWAAVGICLATLVLPATPESAAPTPVSSGMAFLRAEEPREGAFTILVPHGWTARGGIYRENAAASGGPLNALEAKCDLMFSRDETASVMFHILPDIVYAHPGIGVGSGDREVAIRGRRSNPTQRSRPGRR